MRIPITMCHGIRHDKGKPLTKQRLERLAGIAAAMGFSSVSYDDLAAWREDSAALPERPIMFDFDHPVKSMRYEVFDALDRHGFRGNLFMYTLPYDDGYDRSLPWDGDLEHMTWAEIAELREAGWQIGAHTVSHPNLSELYLEDPTGETLRTELDRCVETIQANLGFRPKDFAFTGTSWSSMAEQEVKKRFRFGRLWIVGAKYQVDGKLVRFADLAGVPGPDEDDGGPPNAARYITRDSNPYRLPSMEFQALIHQPAAFRRYLEGALSDDSK